MPSEQGSSRRSPLAWINSRPYASASLPGRGKRSCALQVRAFSDPHAPVSTVKITLPELSLVVLVGASGAGKSTFARRHFLPTEVVSSDACRRWVSDDETDQSATTDAFEVLH